jgi:hypothetical protein
MDENRKHHSRPLSLSHAFTLSSSLSYAQCAWLLVCWRKMICFVVAWCVSNGNESPTWYGATTPPRFLPLLLLRYSFPFWRFSPINTFSIRFGENICVKYSKPLLMKAFVLFQRKIVSRFAKITPNGSNYFWIAIDFGEANCFRFLMWPATRFEFLGRCITKQTTQK